MNYYYSPETGEIITTNPSPWMGSTTIAPPVFDSQAEGCFFQNGGWTLVSSAPAVLAKAQSDASKMISGKCQAAIMAGFASSALGAVYNYPSTPTDQANTMSVALAGGALWCEDSTGKWAFVSHTQAQASQVQKDMVTHVQTQQANNAAKQSAIAAATTLAAVQAVVW